jgi:uncharacterized protein with HEPN domain
MLEAIRDIQGHTQQGQEHFLQDDVLQGYVLHRLMVLGEAAYQMPAELRDSHAEIAWRPITALRHVLVHGYFATDLDAIWVIIERDLPELKAQLERVLGEVAQ